MVPFQGLGGTASHRLLFLQASLVLIVLGGTCRSVQAAATAAPEDSKFWLPGATGSGPYDVAYAWATAFGAKYPEVQLTLSSVGSGAAQKALWGEIDCASKPVEAICTASPAAAVEETLWGMGDAPMDSAVYEERPDLMVQQLPACAGAVAVVYSNEVIMEATGEEDEDRDDQLRLSFQVLAGIFNTTILYWDDAQIQALNPHLQGRLPHKLISKVVRGDSSGQTSILTDALGYNVPTWPKEAVGTSPEWPLGELYHPSELISQTCEAEEETNGITAAVAKANTTARLSFAAEKKSGIVLGMLRVPYSIGYMEMGSLGTLTDFLSQAKIESGGESFTEASAESLLVTMGGLANDIDPETMGLNLAAAENPPGGYPIGGYAYWYLKRNPAAYTSCYQAWLLCKFVEWSYTDPQAADLALELGWVVPPAEVVVQTLERLNTVMCTDTEVNPPAVIPAMSYTPPPYRIEAEGVDKTVVATTTVAAAIILILLLLFVIERRRKTGDQMWKIKKADLAFGEPPEIIGRGKFGLVLLAEYRGTQVAVKRVIPPEFQKLSNGSGTMSKSGSSPWMKASSVMSSEHREGAGDEDGVKTSTSMGSSTMGPLIGVTSGGKSRSNSVEIPTRSRKQIRADFVEEMRYLSRLRHPCVTTIMGAVLGEEPMLVMEYMGKWAFLDTRLSSL